MLPDRPSRVARALVAIAALALLAAGCSSTVSPSPSSSTVGGAGYSVFPVVVSPDLATGENRLLFVFVDKDNKPVSAPDRSASVAVSAGDAPSASATPVAAAFEWGNEAAKQGYYVADVTFPQAGAWSAVFTTSAPNAPKEQIPYQFDVKDKHTAVAVGQAAPKTATPTAASVDGRLAEVSTDQSPDPDFYALSEDQALDQHKPFVIVFATPAFCTSALCGPTLDRVKAISKDYPSVAFIHVEPYQMQVVDGKLQPILDPNGQLQSNKVTDAWGLPAEPWVFVVDRKGVVQASLDIVFGDDELKAAIDKVK